MSGSFGATRGLQILAWLALAVVVALAPQAMSFGQTSVATNALIFAIAAYGLFFLYSQCGQLTAAHAALMGLGSYVVALLNLHLHWSLWAALPVAMVACFGAGLLLGVPSQRIAGHYYLVVTFAFTQVFVLVLTNWSSVTNGTDGLSILDVPPAPGGIDLSATDNYYYLSALAVGVTVVATVLVSRTRYCSRLRAARESEALAASLGMNVNRDRLLAFAISGIFPALAGGLYVYYLTHIQPDTFDITASMNLILMVILGGSLVLLGPVIGALLFGFLPDLFTEDPSVSQVVFGCLLVLAVLVFHRGVGGGIVDGVAAARRRLTSSRGMVDAPPDPPEPALERQGVAR